MEDILGVAGDTAGAGDTPDDPIETSAITDEAETNQPQEEHADPYESKDPNWEKARTSYNRLKTGVISVAEKVLNDDELNSLFKDRDKGIFTSQDDFFGAVAKAVEAKQAKLAELEESQTHYQGIRIDKPSGEWGESAKQQLESLSPNHRNVLVDTVFATYLPEFAQGVLQNPASHPAEFQQLASVASTLASQAYSRPIEQVDEIMALTAGMDVEAVRQLLSGGGYVGNQSFPIAQNGAPHQLYAAAQQAGLDLEDPQQQAFVSLIGQMITANTRELQTLKQELDGYRTTSTKTQVEEAKTSVEAEAEKVRNGLLQSVTKGRVEESDTATAVRIQERAEYRLSRDEKANAALARARDYAADGYQAGVRGEQKLYAARAAAIYHEVAQDELGKNVAKTSSLRAADQQKAARRDVTAGAGGAPLNNRNSTIDDLVAAKRPTRPGDWGDIAAEEARRRAQ